MNGFVLYVCVVFEGDYRISDDLELIFGDFYVDVIVDVNLVFCVEDDKGGGMNGKSLEFMYFELG